MKQILYHNHVITINHGVVSTPTYSLQLIINSIMKQSHDKFNDKHHLHNKDASIANYLSDILHNEESSGSIPPL